MGSSVIGITFNPEKTHVLVIKRRDVPIWTFPGGGKEPSETLEEAVSREVQEETGYQVDILRKAAIYTPINRLTSETHIFECEATGGKPTKGSETLDVGFFPIEKLPDPFFQLHTDWLNDVLQHPKEVVMKPIEQVTYSALIKYFMQHPSHVIRCLLSRMGFPWNSK